MADKKVYPRIPESNWWAIRQKFKQTLPSIVNTSYIKALLNFDTNKAANNLIRILKQFNIIDADGKPLPRANDWRNDEKYKEVCANIATEIYPQTLLDLYPGPDFDKSGITRWFMDDAFIGEPAAKLNTVTYIMLMKGEILTDPVAKKPKEHKRSTKAATENDSISDDNTEEATNDNSESIPDLSPEN